MMLPTLPTVLALLVVLVAAAGGDLSLKNERLALRDEPLVLIQSTGGVGSSRFLTYLEQAVAVYGWRTNDPHDRDGIKHTSYDRTLDVLQLLDGVHNVTANLYLVADPVHAVASLIRRSFMRLQVTKVGHTALASANRFRAGLGAGDSRESSSSATATSSTTASTATSTTTTNVSPVMHVPETVPEEAFTSLEAWAALKTDFLHLYEHMLSFVRGGCRPDAPYPVIVINSNERWRYIQRLADALRINATLLPDDLSQPFNGGHAVEADDATMAMLNATYAPVRTLYRRIGDFRILFRHCPDLADLLPTTTQKKTTTAKSGSP